MKTPSNNMRVEVKASFLNPLTNRMAKVGDQLNVPKTRFWLRRLGDEDIVDPKAKTTAKKPTTTTQQARTSSTK